MYAFQGCSTIDWLIRTPNKQCQVFAMNYIDPWVSLLQTEIIIHMNCMKFGVERTKSTVHDKVDHVLYVASVFFTGITTSISLRVSTKGQIVASYLF